MNRAGRRLSTEEAALWARVAATVAPLHPGDPAETSPGAAPAFPARKREGPGVGKIVAAPIPAPSPSPTPSPPLTDRTLDASWDRRLSRGLVAPDVTLDLHGCTLDAAYTRLDAGLTQARAQGARLMLVITGRPRPAVDPADRGRMRGAIRAKLPDWLANGGHAGAIAALRPAHPRHGGAGALYLVLRRR